MKMMVESPSSIIPGLTDDAAELCLSRIPRCSFRIISQVCRRWRTFLRSEHFAAVRELTGTVEEFMCVLMESECGRDVYWEVFDDSGNKLGQIPPVPGPLKRGFGVAVLDGGKIVFIGGYTEVEGSGINSTTVSASADVYEFDPSTNSWRKLAGMNIARYNFAFAQVDGLLYVIRGYSTDAYSLSNSEVYNPETNQWSLMDCPNRPVWRGFAFSFNSKLYAVGNGSRSIDIYDPKTQTWEELNSEQSVSVYSYTVVRNKVYFMDRNMPGRLGVFVALDKKLKEHEGGRLSNRLFYLSIPPNIFVDAVKCASLSASSVNGWTRVIVEKPFGRDSKTSAALTKSLKQYLEEDQIFRIDHYLGKELVENLSVLRFSNLIFEPLWSRQYIQNVQFIFSEDFGTEGRGGYFDHYGIIRDIMQNHLLQILALFAMETPVSLDAEDIRNEKVKVLRSMRPIQLEDVVIGQYKSTTKGGVTYPGYTDDKTVPKDSLTPTFAAAALFIDNARWDGVPFLMKAGKALHTRSAEIRVQFRHVPGNLYNRNSGTNLDRTTNELVIRVQPDEGIYLKINNKVPGLGMRLDQSNLNLLYSARYSKEIPDAYERLLLDAIEGERRLFIRSDELDAAWALFTPLLKEIEEKKTIPESYPYGSRGPVGAHYLAARHNVQWGDLSDQ